MTEIDELKVRVAEPKATESIRTSIAVAKRHDDETVVVFTRHAEELLNSYDRMREVLEEAEAFRCSNKDFEVVPCSVSLPRPTPQSPAQVPEDKDDDLVCVNAHDRCYGGAGGPCPYCEKREPKIKFTAQVPSVEEVARVIDPRAFESLGVLRGFAGFEATRKKEQTNALEKATAILALFKGEKK